MWYDHLYIEPKKWDFLEGRSGNETDLGESLIFPVTMPFARKTKARVFHRLFLRALPLSVGRSSPCKEKLMTKVSLKENFERTEECK